MKPGYLICILMMGLPFMALSQLVKLKAQVFNNNAVVRNYTLIIDGKPATTDDSGIFETMVAGTVGRVIVVPSDNKYIIVYPSGGNVLLPRDASLAAEIVLGQRSSNKYLLDYAKASKQLNDSIGKSQAEIKNIKKRVDSMITLLYKFNYSDKELKSAREKQDGIDLFEPEISKALQTYIKDAQDLKSAFKYTTEFAFTNHNALQSLVQAVTNYNASFDKLFTNYRTYAQKIGDYWQDENVKASFNGIMDTLLHEVHDKNILPLNDLKNRINQYFLGQADANAKKGIQSEVATRLPILGLQLDALEKRIGEFLVELAAD